MMTTLHIRQRPLHDGKCPILLTLKRPGRADLEAEASIEFALTPSEREELRWYMEDYLTRPDSVEDVQVEQIEEWMKRRGEELYTKVLAANMDTQAVWFAVREQLADLRIEITTGITEGASIPWELMFIWYPRLKARSACDISTRPLGSASPPTGGHTLMISFLPAFVFTRRRTLSAWTVVGAFGSDS